MLWWFCALSPWRLSSPRRTLMPRRRPSWPMPSLSLGNGMQRACHGNLAMDTSPVTVPAVKHHVWWGAINENIACKWMIFRCWWDSLMVAWKVQGWNVDGTWDSQTPRDIFISAKFSESTSHYSFCSASAVLELRYSLTSWQPFHQQQHEVYLLESSGSATTSTTSHFFRIAAELAKLWTLSCGVTLRFCWKGEEFSLNLASTYWHTAFARVY